MYSSFQKQQTPPSSDEATPLNQRQTEGLRRSTSYESSEDDFADDFDEDDFEDLDPSKRFEAHVADRLSVRLLAIADDDEESHERLLRKSLRLLNIVEDKDDEREEGEEWHDSKPSPLLSLSRRRLSIEKEEPSMLEEELAEEAASRRFWTMICMALIALITVATTLWVGVEFIGPPNQPVGRYRLIERQEGLDFFNYYTFYEGKDSAGSAGYNTYVNRDRAQTLGIVNVTMENDELDVYNTGRTDKEAVRQVEPFIYMSSTPTLAGPRESIRLEGLRRFNRGLFIIDLRHMPAGCGAWPAFWLTDEANWPVNGEIDIVEGVNYQTEAKTALHSTQGCSMEDIPLGVMTGTWDTAQGIPDSKTGIPDMTLRYARNCFVYDPHQWLNQGCVAVDNNEGTIGQPFNRKGGGVYALEWDPMNRHIRSWVFTPHTNVPNNLVDAIRTARELPEDRVDPDPSLWPVPYGYYAIGEGTDCDASHFRNMRIVFNLAFCGSVSGNRYHMDCPEQAKTFDTCNDYVKSQPEELNDAYWKIRGVYVYEREWERTWAN